jgi:pimeloyl-ACP methyl ester carboxylesterase
MRDSRHWGSFPATFASTLDLTPVITPDLPGNGQLNNMRSPSCVEGMVEWYRGAILKEGIDPPYYVLGLSLGAMVAVAWSHMYPGELKGVVLVNASLRPLDPFYRRLRLINLLRIVPALIGNSVAKQESLIWHLTSSRPRVNAEILDAWISFKKERPVSRHNSIVQILAAHRYLAPPERPDVAILILASAMDRLVNPICSKHIAKRWGADFAMHPTAGHDAPLDDEQWICLQIRDWLRTVDLRRKLIII